MAGAGYKLFQTGDVLTAAQVNTYLNEQTVMVFANAAARTSALTSVLAEGMVSYLQDTNAVEVYNGSAWVSVGGGASPLTTKGDLYTFSTVDARLAVGNSGETLVADSAATTGLRWQGNYSAGKNKIINGDFNINQRAFSSSTTANTYLFDRYFQNNSGGTATYSAQTFTTGAAPVAGYEGKNYLRIVTSGQTTGNYALLQQNIESVRTLAGQTATFSFWAKAGSGTPNINVRLRQNFGTGGSPSSAVGTLGTVQAITTSWARYSFTINVPSISGKTLGTANDDSLQAQIIVSDDTLLSSGVGIQNGTFELWGLQIENGSVATPFQTATGTIQGELAACQRYYVRLGGTQAYEALGVGSASSTTSAEAVITLPVTMRTGLTAIEYSTLAWWDTVTISSISSAGIQAGGGGKNTVRISGTSTGLTQYRPYQLITNNSTSGYVAFSAEL
jgi:hypothetical protein